MQVNERLPHANGSLHLALQDDNKKAQDSLLTKTLFNMMWERDALLQYAKSTHNMVLWDDIVDAYHGKEQRRAIVLLVLALRHGDTMMRDLVMKMAYNTRNLDHTPRYQKQKR